MEGIFKFLPFLILLYGGYTTWTELEEHDEKVVNLQNQLTGKKAAKKRLEKKVAEVKEFIPQIDSVEKAISDFESKIESIKFKIPPLEVKTDILDELSNEAKKLNIQKVNFKPSYERPNSGGIYITNGLEFDAVGTYLQFLVFFEKLSTANRLFNVNSISVKDSTEGSTQGGRHKIIKANAIIETFHYNENYKPEEQNDKKGTKK